ncbi:MAG: DsbA family protein [Methylobacteriaceae bacterium]|nr:DsbA family protein [Methylobacteriaceae bacterium]MBV9634095.1 DsbA family protein [Methylobacteriaceae bacterium]MBV9705588.1 DsbA family protein [Methylobacteriaceae bacterium]
MRDHPFTTRRRLLVAAGALGVVATGLGGSVESALAQSTTSVDELMAPEALPDVVLGSKDAPVTMVEYASMTCSHCARFHAETYPTLKSKYIDTGKVRFILREFPLDPLAALGFMLARCSGTDDKRTALVDLMFDQQKNWAFVDKPIQALSDLVKQAGFTQDSFDACMQNKDLYDKINQVRDRAAEKFGVDATPTFFINGKKQAGEITVDELEKMLDPLVKS